ncbi:MAG TPA: tetratricopeptide repeat protein [Terriglobales bacterium]|jgi:DNA-binding winged helix-turn-helix (wHTH) protein/tetratricopeptide (TPR) repeat protein|nr:tetratricopeptide repeat protein [Terriglobales bacterium]
MGSSPQNPIRYRFGPYQLDPGEGKLWRDGTRVKLQDLPCRLLVLLVEKPGEVVTREDVRRRLWPQDTFVEFDNSLGVAVRKLREALHDNADSPLFVETVPRRGYRFLAPVSHEYPAGNLREMHEGPLSTIDDGLTKQPGAAVRSQPWFIRYGVVAGLVLLLVGIAVYEFRPVPRRSSGMVQAVGKLPPDRIRRSVAVLGFRNLPGRPEENWLSTALSEMLSTELAAGGRLRLVSGEDVARAKRDLSLEDADTLAKSTLNRLRENPGADVVVLGTYTLLPGKQENRLRLDIRMQDTITGETISEEAFTGSEQQLFELASQAGGRLRQSLGVSPLVPEDPSYVRVSLPSNQEAVKLYAEGRSRLWVFDFVGARDFLVKAVATEPDFPLAHSALSEAWWHLGYSARARAEAERARALAGSLPQEERLLIEGQYRDSIFDWPKAVEAYQELFKLFPDNLGYGLRLASAQLQLKPADSLLTLAALRRIPPPAGDDARIDMEEASAWISQDLGKAHAAAKRAIEKGSAQGSQLLVARVYGILCQQGTSIGTSTAEVFADCELARRRYAAAGDYNNEARTLSDFAGIYYLSGDLERAEAMWREASKEFRRVGDIEGVAVTSNNLGDALLIRGNLDGARKLLEASIPKYQVLEEKSGVALALNDLGDLSRRQGDLAAAETTLQQAKATAEEAGDNNAVGYVLTGLGEVWTDRGDLAAARQSYEGSLALRNQMGENQAVAETQVALAEVSIEEGRAVEAEAAMRKCREQFHHEQQADDELSADVMLIDALLAQGKHGDAKQEVESTEILARKSQNLFIRLQFALASARVLLAFGQPESSRAQAQQVFKQAHDHQLLGVELDARLDLAELEAKSGHSGAAQAQLLALERAARVKGFGLIARKAATERTRTGLGSQGISHGQG